jgi:hypothetical protein
LRFLKPEDFLEIMDEDRPQPVSVRFGSVDSAYTIGRPKIKFDGMDSPGTKLYPYLSSYTPAANDRVMIIQGVVIGKII